jgi:hypothetical protein
MFASNNPLDQVKVAAPCPANWEEMVGNEQVRFCSQCSLNVYNLSGMSKQAAESLIANTEGRLCVRFYRRADGTILTDNCPVGLRALRRRLSRIKTAVISTALTFFAGLGIYAGLSESDSDPLEDLAETGVMAVSKPESIPPPPRPSQAIMGEMSLPVTVVGDLAVRPAKVKRYPSKLRRNISR